REVSGMSLDDCICVHAEQNALLSAARFGTAVEGTTLYTTYKPCFGCLKEAIQAGVGRIVFQQRHADPKPEYREQYDRLVGLLQSKGTYNFERIGGVDDERKLLEDDEHHLTEASSARGGPRVGFFSRIRRKR